MKSKTRRLIDALRGRSHISILFVCLGNICRSPAAEGVMQRLVDERGLADRISIDSAGTGGWHIGQLPDKRMRVHALRRGLTLNHICRQVSTDDFDNFDIIIAMDSENEYNLRELAPDVDAADKVVPMAEFITMATRYDYIPDPYYEGAEGFELVLDLLDDACAALLNDLTR